MASLISLAAEFKLMIIEHLDLTSTSFIPGPSHHLLSLSRVCKALRALCIPSLLKSVTLLNEERSGSSLLTILHGPYAEHVRNVHYIGIMDIPEDQDFENFTRASPDDLPESVEQVLSSLSQLPKLERVVVQFACAKTADEAEIVYSNSFDLFEAPETNEQVLELEKTVAFRSLMERSYRALSSNPSSIIKHLELKDVVAKRCSAWNLTGFHAVLRGLASFDISLRGGDNTVGWQINKVEAYLDFVSNLHLYFFRHLSNVKHFNFDATNDGPPGREGGEGNAALSLLVEHLPQLQSLSLGYVFIGKELSAFIIAHRNTLEYVRLSHCYSGWSEDGAIFWGEFFSSIALGSMRSLRVFEVAASDLEQSQPRNRGDNVYDMAARAQNLREQFPGRRMFDYKRLDEKYGIVDEREDEQFERFETGRDHAGWEQLQKVIKENAREGS